MENTDFDINSGLAILKAAKNLEAGMYNFGNSRGIAGNFDQKARKYGSCVSSLNEAYAIINELDCELLKKVINHAMEVAKGLEVDAQDEYDSKD